MDVDYLGQGQSALMTERGIPDREELARLLSAAARPFVLANDRELSVLRRGLTKAGWKRSLYLQEPPPGEPRLSGAGLLYAANQLLGKSIGIPDCDDDCRYAFAEGCLALALVYQIDREPECAQKAAEILRSFAEVGSPVETHKLDESERAIILAQAYDLIYHSKALSNADRAVIEDGLFRSIARAMTGTEDRGVWAAYQNAAVGVIGCALRDAALLDHAISGVARQLETELGEDGLWLESVQEHHFLALTAFVELAEACCRIGVNLYNLQTPSGNGLETMFRAPINFAYPSFEMPVVGDGRSGFTLPLSLYEIAVRRWNDPVFAWVLKTGYGFAQHPINGDQTRHRHRYTRSSLYAFLFGRDLPGRVNGPKISSTDFRGLGLCVLRSESGQMLTFEYGRPDETPLVNEERRLGFTLFSRNRLMIPSRSSAGAGNTVLIDEQPRPVKGSSLTAFHPGIYIQSAEAEARQVSGDVAHTRRITMIDHVVLIEDTLNGDTAHDFDWLMQCEGIVDEAHLNELTDCGLVWKSQGAGLTAWFAMDSSGHVTVSERPAQGAAQPSSTVRLRRRAKSASFLAVLFPYEGDAPVIQRTGNTFKIVHGDRTDWVYLAGTPGSEDGAPEIESDAELAAVSETEGTMSACGMFGGSYVDLRGERILAGNGRFGRVEVRMEGRNPVVTFDGASGDNLKLKCHSRAMCVNGHRISASCFEGIASIRIVGVLAAAEP